MTTRREVLSDAVEVTRTDVPEVDRDEPCSTIRQSDLSGGPTMWQARLVLSTLDQETQWAKRLRRAIRAGNAVLADALLDDIYARGSKAQASQPPGSTERPGLASRTLTTVLPPAPSSFRREAG